jgi:hypothetical protein
MKQMRRLLCPQCKGEWSWDGEPISAGRDMYVPKPTKLDRATCIKCLTRPAPPPSRNNTHNCLAYRQRVKKAKTG